MDICLASLLYPFTFNLLTAYMLGVSLWKHHEARFSPQAEYSSLFWKEVSSFSFMFADIKICFYYLVFSHCLAFLCFFFFLIDWGLFSYSIFLLYFFRRMKSIFIPLVTILDILTFILNKDWSINSLWRTLRLQNTFRSSITFLYALVVQHFKFPFKKAYKQNILVFIKWNSLLTDHPTSTVASLRSFIAEQPKILCLKQKQTKTSLLLKCIRCI